MVLRRIQAFKNRHGLGISGSRAKKKREDDARTVNTSRARKNRRGRTTGKEYWNSSTKKWQSKPVPRGQNLPPSASEGKGKGPKSNPVGSKPDPKSAEKRYSPGDLTKNPKKAYYSPSLGRYVTGAGIKAQAEADRRKAQKTKKQEPTKQTPKSKEQSTKSEKESEPKKSNVFTRHYKTGKRTGVMTRRQRRKYDAEAKGRTFEGEVAKTGDKSNKRETNYKASQRKKKNRKKISIKKPNLETYKGNDPNTTAGSSKNDRTKRRIGN
jgi:hypothetical protein